jgi:hypothetical protein
MPGYPDTAGSRACRLSDVRGRDLRDDAKRSEAFYWGPAGPGKLIYPGRTVTPYGIHTQHTASEIRNSSHVFIIVHHIIRHSSMIIHSIFLHHILHSIPLCNTPWHQPFYHHQTMGRQKAYASLMKIEHDRQNND